MEYTYCIWDFNGTILDDVGLGIYTVNELLKNHGVELVLDRESYRSRFGFPIVDYYRELGFDFAKTPYRELASEWVKIYMDNLHRASLFDDVIRTLDFFKARGIRQSVLSASEKKMLSYQLDGLGVGGYFEEIMGIDNIYGDSKLSLAKKWRERNPSEKVIFIGDTTHDIETACELSAECYIVCAGHQSEERFSEKNVKLFSTLTELTEALI